MPIKTPLQVSVIARIQLSKDRFILFGMFFGQGQSLAVEPKKLGQKAYLVRLP
jgi:hypothetical protein